MHTFLIEYAIIILVTPPIHYIVLLHPISNKNTFSKKMTVRWSSFFVFFSNYFIDSFKIKFTSFLVAVSFLHKKYFYKYKIGVFR